MRKSAVPSPVSGLGPAWRILLALSLLFTLPARTQTIQPEVFTAATFGVNGGRQLNVYLAVPSAWLRAAGIDSTTDLRADFELLSRTGRIVNSHQQHLGTAIGGRILPARLFEASTSFLVEADDYRLRISLLAGAKSIWSSAEISVRLAEIDSPLALSQLTPLRQPRFGLPPFDSIAWPQLGTIGDDFFLYYELKTAVPDTFVTMFATLRNEQNQVVHQEQYRIYLSDSLRNDFLRVKTESLPAGGYVLELHAGAPDSPVFSRYAFEIQRPMTSQSGSAPQWTAWMRRN